MGGSRTSMCRMHLGLLGGFELRVSDETVDMPSSCRRLVAFLALHDRPVNRGYVAGNLWLDKTEQRAAANLRSALWRLPETPEDVVLTRGGEVWLNQAVQVDTRRVEKLARHEEYGDESEPVPAGPLLPDWTDEWLVLERERLRQLQLSALEARCERLIESGVLSRAIETAWSAIRIEPLHESAHRCLVRAHLAAGNVVEALRHGDLFARLLADELGLDPSPALKRLLDPYRRATVAEPARRPITAAAIS